MSPKISKFFIKSSFERNFFKTLWGHRYTNPPHAQKVSLMYLENWTRDAWKFKLASQKSCQLRLHPVTLLENRSKWLRQKLIQASRRWSAQHIEKEKKINSRKFFKSRFSPKRNFRKNDQLWPQMAHLLWDRGLNKFKLKLTPPIPTKICVGSWKAQKLGSLRPLKVFAVFRELLR